MGIIWLLYSLCYHLVVTHIVPRATDIGITPAKAALVLALIGGGNILGRLAMGIASDKMGRKISAIVCALVQVASMTWVAWSNDLWMFYLFSVIFGLFWGTLGVALLTSVSDIFGQRNLGTILGTLEMSFSVGSAIGPALGGLVFDVTGKYAVAFTIGAVALLMVTPLIIMTKHEVERL